MRIQSEIPLPELIAANERNALPDIEILLRDMPGEWSESLFEKQYFAVLDQRVLFRFPNAARVCVENGKRILVSPMENADWDLLRIYLLGSAMGAILLQRKMLPLHGSAVAIDGRAYAFVGESGAGKSTLAAAFLHRGLPLVSDDVIAVSFAADKTPMVAPSYPQQKLWQESIAGLNMEFRRYTPLYQRTTKFAVPVLERFAAAPIPLAGVFELVPTRIGEGMYPLSGLQKLPVFRAHTYRGALLPFMRMEQWHFAMAASIASRIDVFRLYRPLTGFTAQRLAARILNMLQKER
ncbi:MAG TPA: aldolase [Bacilli bacterium]